jgi:hypothetical protein
MPWADVVRALADLLTAIAAIIAAVYSVRARRESKEARQILQTMQKQSQSQAIHQHQYFYLAQTVGEGKSPLRPVEFSRGDLPPEPEAGPPEPGRDEVDQ